MHCKGLYFSIQKAHFFLSLFPKKILRRRSVHNYKCSAYPVRWELYIERGKGDDKPLPSESMVASSGKQRGWADIDKTDLIIGEIGLKVAHLKCT